MVRYYLQLCSKLANIKIVDCGDYVIVTNARHVLTTGQKAEQKLYRKHTMYPGGLKETPYKVMMDRKPDEVCRCVSYVPRSPLNAFVLDYSKSRLWHVTEKQTPRPETRAVKDIRRWRHGSFQA